MGAGSEHAEAVALLTPTLQLGDHTLLGGDLVPVLGQRVLVHPVQDLLYTHGHTKFFPEIIRRTHVTLGGQHFQDVRRVFLLIKVQNIEHLSTPIGHGVHQNSVKIKQ